jgi:hypothetical protein
MIEFKVDVKTLVSFMVMFIFISIFFYFINLKLERLEYTSLSLEKRTSEISTLRKRVIIIEEKIKNIKK